MYRFCSNRPSVLSPVARPSTVSHSIVNKNFFLIGSRGRELRENVLPEQSRSTKCIWRKCRRIIDKGLRRKMLHASVRSSTDLRRRDGQFFHHRMEYDVETAVKSGLSHCVRSVSRRATQRTWWLYRIQGGGHRKKKFWSMKARRRRRADEVQTFTLLVCANVNEGLDEIRLYDRRQWSNYTYTGNEPEPTDLIIAHWGLDD